MKEPTPEQLQAESYLVIKGIVERYGGTATPGFADNGEPTIYINVPAGKEHEVALELDKALPGQCC